MLLNGAANRDPRRFECPAEFRIDRPNAQAHIAFGRGAHSCPGGPLARVEGRVSLERILDRMRNIRLSEEHHGPAGARRFELRADVDPPRPHERCTSSSTRSEGDAMSRVAVVTGGASGIGLGVAQQFAADGHRVAHPRPQRGRPRRPRPTSSRPPAARRSRVEVDVADRASVDAGVRHASAPSSARSRSSSRAPGIESFDPVRRHHARDLGPDHRGQPHRHVHLRAGRRARHARRRLGPHRHHLVVERAVGRARAWPTTRRRRAASSG